MFANAFKVAKFVYQSQKNFGGEKLVNCELLAKIFLVTIHTENVFGIYTDCSLFATFLLANSFYLYGSPKIFPAKYFLCTVIKRLRINFVKSYLVVFTKSLIVSI